MDSSIFEFHYKNKPIQIYWKLYHQKYENFQIKNFDILSYFYSKQSMFLSRNRRVGFNEYPQSMFLSRNTKNNVYPCKLQFYYIKVGFKGVNII